MRSIRIATAAGATALSLMLGTTVASAAEPTGTTTETDTGSSTVGSSGQAPVVEDAVSKAPAPEEGAAGSSLSSRINNTFELEGDQGANGVALFGSSKDGFTEQPAWAQLLYAGTVLGAIATVIGGIIGPVHNFFVHGPQA